MRVFYLIAIATLIIMRSIVHFSSLNPHKINSFHSVLNLLQNCKKSEKMVKLHARFLLICVSALALFTICVSLPRIHAASCPRYSAKWCENPEIAKLCNVRRILPVKRDLISGFSQGRRTMLKPCVEQVVR